MDTPIITVQNLNKKYHLYDKNLDRLKEVIDPRKRVRHKVFEALHDISFSVLSGETFGIIGTNGSGKSTLLKILTGIVAPSAGTVSVRGKISALLELGAGFNPAYTGRQNIYLNGTMMNYTREEMNLRLDDIIRFADIGDFIDQPVKNYSSGMFARLAFAVAINVEPDVLIVDEALSVGDVFFQNKCFRKFEELKKKGITVLFVSHDIESVKRMCDRVLWIEHGEQKMLADGKSVCNAYAASILQKNNEQIEGENERSPIAYKTQKLQLSNYPHIQECSNESILDERVRIIAFFFETSLGNSVYTLRGGEEYTLSIVFESKRTIENAIAGFVMQTKKGVTLINTNSLVCGEKGSFYVKQGSLNRVDFTFTMPAFASDEYIFDCAVAEGKSVNGSRMITWLYGAMRVFIENTLGDLGLLDVEAKVQFLSAPTTKAKGEVC